MILSGKEIKNKLGFEIIIEPFTEKQLNPNSYNLKWHHQLLVYKNSTLDMKSQNDVERIDISYDGLVLMPSTLYLGRTVEFTETNGYVPMLEGRSSVGRLGGICSCNRWF